MDSLRWDQYVLIHNNEINHFWEKHFNNNVPTKNVLFITSKGFDVRMNFVLKNCLSSKPNINLTCLLVEYHEGSNSPSIFYQESVRENLDELKKTLVDFSHKTYESLYVDLWKDKRRIGDRDISNKIYNYDINPYTDIIVDISSLPRGIYFSLIGTLLKKIDAHKELNNKNLFVTVAENAKIDKQINEEGVDENIKWIHGFGGEIETESNHKPLIFFPILGEKKINILGKIYSNLAPEEICPVLPFPSKDPRRSDSLIIDYHKVLFDELRVESQNILYVPEQNPFEVYRILSSAIENYNESLKILGGCNAALTAFSSKLLSLGVLLVAYEKGKGIGVYNLESQGYNIANNNIEYLKELNKDSEIFLLWLNGDAYEE